MTKGRKVLLLEPGYKNKYPPMGLMKLATYFRQRGDDVRFYKGDLKRFAADLLLEEFLDERFAQADERIARGRDISRFREHIRTGKLAFLGSACGRGDEREDALLRKYRARYKGNDYPKFDIVCVTTLFTFYWKETMAAINSAKSFCRSPENIFVGGIASSILPELVFEETGIRPHVGLLDKGGEIDKDSAVIIDELPLDYSILEESDYRYPASDAYFAYMTRGCPRGCQFCAVPKLEPQYRDHIGLKAQLEYANKRFGAKKDLLLMDNNVLASKCFAAIVDEIKECGFGKDAALLPENEYATALANLRDGFSTRAYTKKALRMYDALTRRLSECEQGALYLKREKAGLLYPETATVEGILAMDEYAAPLFAKHFKQMPRKRFVDFNQGIDARLVNDANMAKLAETNIVPLRIAFDHYSEREVYVNAVKAAARHGIRELSNYLLYNFDDTPEELYLRMKINVELCESEGLTIYSFPMKYHPISDPMFFGNRDYVGTHWNRKFIRAVQAVLNATKGKIGRGKAFFEEAFGEDVGEFEKILWMPEPFIIYRRKHDRALRERLAERYGKSVEGESDLANEWWERFSALPEPKAAALKALVGENRFDDAAFAHGDPDVRSVLDFYRFRRE